ncbi:MAG: OB-fold domain-containing protein [Leptospiraceae bacterium]|nr:OB-fold domain-containing protein [Leptospiraceae bacterium]
MQNESQEIWKMETVKELMQWASRTHSGLYLLGSESNFDFSSAYEKACGLAVELQQRLASSSSVSQTNAEQKSENAGTGKPGDGWKGSYDQVSLEGPGHGIALYLDNGLDLAFYSLACLLADLPILALHPHCSPSEIAQTLKSVPCALITDEHRRKDLEPLWPSPGIACIIADYDAGRKPEGGTDRNQAQSPQPNSAAVLLRHSGPDKEVSNLSQRDLVQSALRLHLGLGLTAEHRLGCLDSISDIAWLVTSLLLPLFSGSSLRLFPLASQPAGSGTVVEEKQNRQKVNRDWSDVNYLLGSARSFQKALKAEAILNVSGGLAGGDFFSQREMQEFGHRMGWPLRLGYSLKECAGFVALSEPVGAAGLPGTSARSGQDPSVGLNPLPGVEFRIVPDSEKGPNPSANPGLQVSMPGQVFVGLALPVELAQAHQTVGNNLQQVRWLPTGDAGLLRDAKLHLMGRLSDAIRRMDEIVFPEEVEWALRLHPSIQEAVVLGLPDVGLGEQVTAFVVSGPQQSVEDRQIMDSLRSFLPPDRLPGRILRVLRIPRDRWGRAQRQILQEDHARKQKVLNKVPGVIDIEYRWVYGKALSRFYAGLMNEEIIYGTRCPSCNRIQVPPKIYCGVCFVECTEYVQVPRTGVLESFTTVYLEYPGQPKKPPYTYGYVKLDGAHTHLYHLVESVDLDQISTGMRVEAVFKPAADRTGTLYDIKYFQPIQSIEPIP